MSCPVPSRMSSFVRTRCTATSSAVAVQTYLRRYLWVNAFEIVEQDGLEATTGKTESGPISKTQANVNAVKIEDLIARKEVNPDAVKQHIISAYSVSTFDKLTGKQAKDLIEMLNQKPDKNV